MGGFKEVNRNGQTVWLNTEKPAWIVFYPGIEDVRAGFYQAYVPIGKVKSQSEPWGSNNKRIGDPIHGFPSLESAISATESQP